MTPLSRARIVAKDLAALWALAAVFPLNAAVVAGTLAYGALRGARPTRAASFPRKNVLVSGGKMTKALQLARSFHAAGHRVVLAESRQYWLVGHRFSRAIDRFVTLPKPSDRAYVDALLAVVARERIDAYVPVCSPVASHYDSLAMPRLLPQCDVMHVEPNTIDRLDDKYLFSRLATELELAVPKTYLITDPEQVVRFDFSRERRPYILKSIAYDSVRRLDLTRLPAATPAETAAFARSLPISERNPWILQEFVAGREFCTHGTFRDGELRAYCCCPSSAFQINYESVEKPEIEAWVTRFGRGARLTGQASFDFIEADDDGRTYAIECNPRTHSAITLFAGNPGVATAYLEHAPMPEPARPEATSPPTYWIYHELWRLVTHLRSPRATVERLRTIARGRDAVFDRYDPLPFLMLHHWHVPLLLLRDLREQRGWLRIDFNIGKLVQPGGD